MNTTNLQTTWLSLGFDMSSFDIICQYYSEPHRYYHTLEHIQASLALFEPIQDKLEEPLAMQYALWFHDIIYEPTHNDNEEQSALLAQKMLMQFEIPLSQIEATMHLIQATKHPYTPQSIDEQYIIDIDLAILGSSQYDTYQAKIRQEYSHLSNRAYQEGRIKVLQSFLAQSSIYSTEYFHTRFEQKARDNITQEIAQLHP